MMRGTLADFVKDVRDGLDHFDGSIDWRVWLDNARRNVVAVTIVFCFVFVTGSCVALPVIGLTKSDTRSSAQRRSDEAAERSAPNPWSFDEPRPQPR